MSHIESHQPGWQPPFCPNPNCPITIPCVTPGPSRSSASIAAGQTPPYPAVSLQSLRCHLQFTDLLRRLLAQATRHPAPTHAQDLRRHGQPPDRPRPWLRGSTVNGQLSRLGRHCLLFHQRLLQNAPPPGDIAIDGLETFEYSQYFPFHHNLALDNASGAILSFTDSPLRRKGRMTVHQKRRRQELEAELGRPDPKAIQTGIRDLLLPLLAGLESVTVRSDDHPAYVRAMRGPRLPDPARGDEFRRPAGQPQPAVGGKLADMVLRHASKNHTRETIAWSKRRQRSSERLAVFVVWRNCVQWRREKRRRETPAMVAGWCERKLEPEDVLRRRLFVSQITLPPRWQEYYWGKVETPALGPNRRHELRRAV